jgi:hypothetical protein
MLLSDTTPPVTRSNSTIARQGDEESVSGMKGQTGPLGSAALSVGSMSHRESRLADRPSLEERRELEDFDPEAAEELAAKQKAMLDAEWPKPEEQDIRKAKERLETLWHDFRYGEDGKTDENGEAVDEGDHGDAGLARIRQMRHHRDAMPPKWAKQLDIPYRFRSNLTANEIERTVALATRNRPNMKISPMADDAEARAKAEKEARWANELLPALERHKPFVRVFADSLFESGRACWEIYSTGAFDEIDFEDEEDDEPEREFNDRKDRELQNVAARGRYPVGVRVPDMMSTYYEEDDDGVTISMVIEMKRYKQIYEKVKAKVGTEKFERLDLPDPGDSGVPVTSAGMSFGSGGQEVETIRYYDRRWYVWEVGGKIIECIEHGMPGNPIIPAWGVSTSSSKHNEQARGVVGGTIEMEQALNDLITTEIDIGIVFGRPKAAIETPIEGSLRDDSGKPSRVDFSSNGTPELMPGQKVVDAFKDFKSRIDVQLTGTIMQIREQSSLNPVASGESPGSDPAGYTVNALSAAAQMKYEILLDNFAKSIGLVVDFIRNMVKYGPIEEKVYLLVDGSEDAVEFLALGPEDVSDVPTKVVINPLNDINRLAIRQSLIDGNKQRFVPRSIVQSDGFGAEDPDAWDDEINEDYAIEQFRGIAFEQARMELAMEASTPAPPSGSGLVDPRGNPLSSGGGGGAGDGSDDAGAEPADPNAPSVGLDQSEASQSSSAGGSSVASRARGGQRPRNQGIPQGGG